VCKGHTTSIHCTHSTAMDHPSWGGLKAAASPPLSLSLSLSGWGTGDAPAAGRWRPHAPRTERTRPTVRPPTGSCAHHAPTHRASDRRPSACDPASTPPRYFSAWWVIRRAADGGGAGQHAPVKKCRILEDLSLRMSTFLQRMGVCAPVSDALHKTQCAAAAQASAAQLKRVCSIQGWKVAYERAPGSGGSGSTARA
jgi:hypothetical protein